MSLNVMNLSIVDGNSFNNIGSIIERFQENTHLTVTIIPSEIMIEGSATKHLSFSISFQNDSGKMVLAYNICDVSGARIDQYAERYVVWPLFKKANLTIHVSWDDKKTFQTCQELINEMNLFINTKE